MIHNIPTSTHNEFVYNEPISSQHSQINPSHHKNGTYSSNSKLNPHSARFTAGLCEHDGIGHQEGLSKCERRSRRRSTVGGDDDDGQQRKSTRTVH